MNKRFAKAFAVLAEPGIAQKPDGRYSLDGDDAYYIVQHYPTRPVDLRRFESHKKYIDIQVVISGTDEMGWKNKATCKMPHGAYDAEKEAEFFADTPDAWVAVGPGAFTIFFPEDAHAPLATTGEVVKAVVKVAVAW